MSQPIEEITGRSGGNNVKKTLEKWGYTPGKGFASSASQQNTGKNTTHENSNDKFDKNAVSSKQAGAVGGGMTANTITQAQSSDTNNSAGDQSGGSMKHRASDAAKFGAVAKKGSFDPSKSGISFPNMDPKLQTLKKGYERIGVNISDETMSKMDADVMGAEALKAPGQTTKAQMAAPVEKESSHLEAFSDRTDIQ